MINEWVKHLGILESRRLLTEQKWITENLLLKNINVGIDILFCCRMFQKMYLLLDMIA